MKDKSKWSWTTKDRALPRLYLGRKGGWEMIRYPIDCHKWFVRESQWYLNGNLAKYKPFTWKQIRYYPIAWCKFMFYSFQDEMRNRKAQRAIKKTRKEKP